MGQLWNRASGLKTQVQGGGGWNNGVGNPQFPNNNVWNKLSQGSEGWNSIYEGSKVGFGIMTKYPQVERGDGLSSGVHWNNRGGWSDERGEKRPGTWYGTIKPLEQSWDNRPINSPRNGVNLNLWNKGYIPNQSWNHYDNKEINPVNENPWYGSNNPEKGSGWSIDKGGSYSGGYEFPKKNYGQGDPWLTDPRNNVQSQSWGSSSIGSSNWYNGYNKPPTRYWGGDNNNGLYENHNVQESASWGGGYDKGYASGWNYRPMSSRDWDRHMNSGWYKEPINKHRDPISVQWNMPQSPSVGYGFSWNQGSSNGHEHGAHNKQIMPLNNYNKPLVNSNFDKYNSQFGSPWTSHYNGENPFYGSNHGKPTGFHNGPCSHREENHGFNPSDPHHNKHEDNYPIDPRTGYLGNSYSSGSYSSGSEQHQHLQYNGHSGVGADVDIRPGYIYERPTTVIIKNSTKHSDHDQEAATATISPNTTSI
uniref:Uncharacterized protein n=1 Tax=Clastoptera arizonana TaxID=38151 RepID=A0A1B6DXF5_9HEMI